MPGIPGGRLSPDGSSVIVDLACGTPETGLWCDACLLPSGVAVPVHALAEDGPHLLMHTRLCDICSRPLKTTEDR
jgi:hypothetical protein